MYKVLSIALALLTVFPLAALSNNKMGVVVNDLFSDSYCRADFTKIQLSRESDVTEAVTSYLFKENINFSSKISGLRLQFKKESPVGLHLTFEQLYDGIPVFNSQVKVNLNKSNQIRSVFDNSHATSYWNHTALIEEVNKIDENDLVAQLIKKYGIGLDDLITRKVIAVIDEQPYALLEADIYHPVSHIHRLLLIDDNMEVILDRDLNSYSGHRNEQGTALVFIPDPLTTAKVMYGPPYIDNNDSDIPELNNERFQVDITVTLTGDTYTLSNEYVEISDYSDPDIPPVTQTGNAIFSYTRSQPGFEDVNAFYHLSVYQQYVTSLGFADLAEFRVYADPHALNGDDNSMFSYHITNGPRFFFGEGGVDDAEDADVIVHEYGHALSNSGSPNTNVGNQRTALDEGLCDYFAASYSKAIDTFRWGNVFSWDGHNEFWAGRIVTSKKKYPDDLDGNIHLDGEIWSSAMMEIHDFIGREKADKLQLQSLYSYAQNMKLKDAAPILIDADSALFQGENFCVIYSVMSRRGFLDTLAFNPCKEADKSIVVNAGPDQVICRGDTALIGNSAVFNDRYIYSWGPAVNLSHPNQTTTKAFPESTTNYMLTAVASNGAYNQDQVTVQVNQCKIIIIYTKDFYAGREQDIVVKFPEESLNKKIEVFDLLGKEVFVKENIDTDTYYLNGNLLATGAYILRVSTQDKCKNKKIVKLW